MSSPFGPPGTNRGRTGIPGVGSTPNRDEEEDQFWSIPIEELYPGYNAETQTHPAPTTPAPGDIPATEPVVAPTSPAPLTEEAPVAEPTGEPNTEYTGYTMSVEELMEGNEFYGQSYDEEDPFATRKRRLKAMGASREATAFLEQYPQSLLQLNKRDRKTAFDNTVEQLRKAGISENEITNLQKYLDIAGYTPKPVEEMGAIEAIQYSIGEQAKIHYGMMMSSFKAYDDYVGKNLRDARKGLRGKIYEEKRRIGLGTGALVGIEYVKDMIKAENWQGINELSDQGKFPTVDELGEDWLNETLSVITEGKTEVQSRAIRRLLISSTTNEHSTWLREGKFQPIVPTKFVAEHQKLSILPLALAAPFEIAADWATDPEMYPKLIVMYLTGKFVVAPATAKFVAWANTKPVIGFNITRHMQKMVKTTKTPITDEVARNFMRNIESGTADFDISGAPLQARTFMEWMQTRMQNQTWTKNDIKFIKFFMQRTKLTGQVYLYVPKNPDIMGQMFAQARAGVPPTGPLLSSPPPMGAASTTGAAQTMSTAGAAVGAEFGLPASAAIPVGQIPGHMVSKGIIELAATTGHTIEQIQFMRGLDMNDETIISLGEQNRTRPAGAITDSPVPQDGDRVIVPRLGWQEGTMSWGADPLSMRVQFDDGTVVPVERGDVWRKEDLGFGSDKPPAIGGKAVAKAKESAVAKRTATTRAAKKVTPNDPYPENEVTDRLAEVTKRSTDMTEKAEQAVEGIKEALTDVAIANDATARLGENAIETVKAQAQADKAVAEIQQNVQDLDADVPELPATMETEIETTQAAAKMIEDPEAAPSPLISMPDGTPIWQVPLNNYLLQGETPQIQTIKSMRAHQIGFRGVDYKDQKRYIDAIGRIVNQELPKRVDAFNALKKKWQNDISSVNQHEFDNFLSEDHTLHSRIAFRDAMDATGKSDPGEAAQLIHRKNVRRAINEGLPVPPEVLKSYPQIQKSIEDPNAVRTVSKNVTEAELLDRGYLRSQVSQMAPEVQEWAITNNIDPDDIAILKNGQVVEIKGAIRPINNPKRMKGALNDPSIPQAEFDAELNSVEALIRKLMTEEDGFMEIPFAESVLKLREMSSTIVGRIRNSWKYRKHDVITDFEAAIDKWFGEQKVAELNAEWTTRKLNKILDKSWWDAWRKGGQKFKTPIEEREMIVRFRDDPETFAGEDAKLSPQARRVLEVVDEIYIEAWTVANNAGIINSWIDNYINRIYKDSPDKVLKTQYGVSKTTLATTNTHAAMRKYKTLQEAEANGLHPILDPVILANVYLLELGRSIANKNLIEALMALETENGLPAVMSKPSANDPTLDIWEKDYVTVHIQGMDKWQFAAKIGGKPGFVKVNARATPYVAKRLNNIFDAYAPRGKVFKALTGIKAIVMSLKMINPAIHLSNIYSDILDEFNFLVVDFAGRPGAIKALKNARAMFNDMDERILQLAKAGLDLKLGTEVSHELRRMTQAQITWLDNLPGGMKQVAWPVKKIMETSHKITWEGVRDAQIAMANMLTKKFMAQHPDWTEAEAMKVAVQWTNTNLGTLPHHWMSPWMRKYGATLLFARNWCCSGDTRAMTKTGWKYHNELKIDDEILTVDPETLEMNWSPINDIFINENYSGDMIQIENYNKTIKVTPDHKCLTWNYSKEKYEVVYAKDLKSSHVIPRIGSYKCAEKETYSKRFIKIIGWMVTDGHIKHDKYGKENKVCKYGRITQSKPNGVAAIQELGLTSHVCKPRKHKPINGREVIERHPVYSFYVPTTIIKEMEEAGIIDGLSFEFLSKLTKNQLQTLYDTMMLGDGTGQGRFCGKEKEVFYMSMIQIMLEKPTTFWQETENCWRTRIVSGNTIKTHKSTSTVNYEGTIWCPSVDTGFWVAEREGIIFLTGNTLSNIDMFVKASTVGKYGRGMKGMSPDQQRAQGRHAQWHLIKGMIGLVTIANAVQMLIQSTTNALKKADKMKGEVVPVVPTFMNESPRHWFDIWVGRSNKGQNIYITGWLFRYMRDYIGFATEPRQTFLNKMSIELRAATEIMNNYQGWLQRPIIDEAAPKADQVKQGLGYFLNTVLPTNLYAKREGSVPTAIEYMIPFTGSWIRRGTPGGKMAALYFDFRSWQEYQDNQLEKKIDEAIQGQNWVKFAELAPQRYVTSEAMKNRVLKNIMPLYYLMSTAGERQLLDFNTWLQKEGKPALRDGYNMADIAEGIQWEVRNQMEQQLNDPDRIDTMRSYDKYMEEEDYKEEVIPLEDIPAQGAPPVPQLPEKTMDVENINLSPETMEWLRNAQ